MRDAATDIGTHADAEIFSLIKALNLGWRKFHESRPTLDFVTSGVPVGRLGRHDEIGELIDTLFAPGVTLRRLYAGRHQALDGFHAGLSWLTILKKRDAFRRAFADFDPDVVAKFDEADILRLLGDEGIRGFKFVGPAIVYAWMQAVGMVDDHATSCSRRGVRS